MMKSISQFVVSVMNLVEAEGRELRTVVRGEARDFHDAYVKIAMGTAFLFVAVPLLIAGVALVATGFMWWLETQVTKPLAAVFTGAATCLLGFICLFVFRALAKRSDA